MGDSSGDGAILPPISLALWLNGESCRLQPDILQVRFLSAPPCNQPKDIVVSDKYDRFPSLRLYDQLGIPYVVTSEQWGGPLWTGHCMMLSTDDSYDDPGFFHELCHYLAATPYQRKLPDFALGRQVNARTVDFASPSTPHFVNKKLTFNRGWGDTKKKRNVGWGEKTVTVKTAARQESVSCHALGLYEPLCGIWGWDDPIHDPHKINSAFFDFAASDGPDLSLRAASWCWREIVVDIDPRVSEQMVRDYFQRVKQSLKDEVY